MKSTGIIIRHPPVLTLVIEIRYQPLAPLLPVAYDGASMTKAQNVETAKETKPKG